MLKVRFLFLAGALLIAQADTSLRSTQAYFTSAAAPAGSMSTVLLDASTSSTVSSVFNIPDNLLPGDFQVQTIDVVNDGTVGSSQQDFTYALSSTSSGGGNRCSLLDASDPPACSTPALPNATATSGAAVVILRCTSDAAATAPVACGTAGVYVTQVYPAAGVGTQRQIAAAGGLTRSAVGGVATGGSYSIDIAGGSFTGGPLLILTPSGLGGPDAIVGADGQTHGLAAGGTDHLASVLYLPTQAGPTLADQTSILTFTWTMTQRLGGTR
jgi:hypothetical protein